MKNFMSEKLTPLEVAEEVKIFLEKHSLDRSRVVIEDKDYQFKFGEISQAEVDSKTVNELDGYWQVHFNCKHSRVATGVTTSNISAYVQAHAFYVEDKDKDIVLMKIVLTNIKDKD